MDQEYSLARPQRSFVSKNRGQDRMIRPGSDKKGRKSGKQCPNKQTKAEACTEEVTGNVECPLAVVGAATTREGS